MVIMIGSLHSLAEVLHSGLKQIEGRDARFFRGKWPFFALVFRIFRQFGPGHPPASPVEIAADTNILSRALEKGLIPDFWVLL
jgi:hypothetical protein